MNKIDYLQECMSEFRNIPIDSFNKEFCLMCANRGCSRSWGNQSIFDKRVGNWHDDLFKNVKRYEIPGVTNTRFEPIINKLPDINSIEKDFVVKSFDTVQETSKEIIQLDYEDIPDTDPHINKIEVEEVEEVEPSSIQNEDMMNTTFEKQVTLQGSEVKDEEKIESPGCVFVFDDD